MEDVLSKIEEIIKSRIEYYSMELEECDIRSRTDTCEYLSTMKKELNSILEEIKKATSYTPPKHSRFETIYVVGSEPMWKVGDTLAYYEFECDREGEVIVGEVVCITYEDEDWLYKFENGSIWSEADLISEQVYRKEKK